MIRQQSIETTWEFEQNSSINTRDYLLSEFVKNLINTCTVEEFAEFARRLGVTIKVITGKESPDPLIHTDFEMMEIDRALRTRTNRYTFSIDLENQDEMIRRIMRNVKPITP